MSGTTLYLLAAGSALLGRWAHNRPVKAKDVIFAAFGGIVIAALDSGASTAGIARGLAALVLAAVLLGSSSPLEALSKVKG